MLACEPQCAELCTSLNGNLTRECGACASALACHPGADGFADWISRSVARQQTSDSSSNPEDKDVSANMARVPLCPSDGGHHALPVLRRFCQRAVRICARVDSAIQWHLEHIQPAEGEPIRPLIIHREKPRVGAGFAHVLQEQAMVLLLGLVLSRPAVFRADPRVFNRHGGLVGPDAGLTAVVYDAARGRPLRSGAAAAASPRRWRSARGWSTFLGCRAARAKLLRNVVPPYRCHRAGGDEGGEWDDGSEVGAADAADEPGAAAAADLVEESNEAAGAAAAATAAADSGAGKEWVLRLEDGNAFTAMEALKERWSRWTHVAKQGTSALSASRLAATIALSPIGRIRCTWCLCRRQSDSVSATCAGAPLSDYFPSAPFMFNSPSVLNMYAADFVLADGALDATMRNTRASVRSLSPAWPLGRLAAWPP